MPKALNAIAESEHHWRHQSIHSIHWPLDSGSSLPRKVGKDLESTLLPGQSYLLCSSIGGCEQITNFTQCTVLEINISFKRLFQGYSISPFFQKFLHIDGTAE
jgi:hypothetical protein